MSLPKIKISLPFAGCGARIEIDGTELRNVTDINVQTESGKPPKVLLQLIGDIEIETEGAQKNVYMTVKTPDADSFKQSQLTIRGDPKK